MAFEFNMNLYPPSGYVFTERDGTRHKGGSWKDLTAKVERYRALKGEPITGVWDEIMRQVCRTHPSFCGTVETVERRPGHSLTFNQRILEWLGRLLALKRQKKVATVSDEEAERRAIICSTCPKMKALSRACEACLVSVNRARKILRDEKPLNMEHLHPCDALGEDVPSSVYLNLPPSTVEGLPEHCWRREK